ncbi:MAG: long-chain fatty acid transporter [Alistipes sp.]|nr:long-chain fatty acid transporter [Alistipes sp.]
MRKIITAAALLMSTGLLWAQSFDFGGSILNHDVVQWTDIYTMSYTSHNYGTARSMGMGNAFTALGADLASASINPAGIGMYIKSDISLSPMLQFARAKSDGETYKKENSSRFGMASIGGVFTAYEGTGSLVNLNIGVVYNRIADFNHTSSLASIGNPYTSSIANIFCTLSNIDGLQTNANGTMDFPNNPYYWGAVLAYKNGLTNKDSQGWFIDRIGNPYNAAPAPEIDQFTTVESRGSIGEYAITMGMNFNDRLYVGATLGIQSVEYKRSIYYGENYFYVDDIYPSGEDMPYQLMYMGYQQNLRLSGTGVNLKLGVTWRPIDNLRLGVAFHTPTWYSLSLRYDAEMWSATHSSGNNPDNYQLDHFGDFYDNVGVGTWEDSGPDSWNFSSPARLLFGAAYTIAGRVIVSADYERDWYQGIHTGDNPVNLNYRDHFSKNCKGSNTVRVGAEAYLLPSLAVRLGYIYNSSMLKDESIIAATPIPTKSTYITAGLGFKFNDTVYLDLAYQYGSTDQTAYKLFYATNDDASQNIESRTFTTSINRHIAVATIGFRF